MLFPNCKHLRNDPGSLILRIWWDERLDVLSRLEDAFIILCCLNKINYGLDQWNTHSNMDVSTHHHSLPVGYIVYLFVFSIIPFTIFQSFNGAVPFLPQYFRQEIYFWYHFVRTLFNAFHAGEQTLLFDHPTFKNSDYISGFVNLVIINTTKLGCLISISYQIENTN